MPGGGLAARSKINAGFLVELNDFGWENHGILQSTSLRGYTEPDYVCVSAYVQPISQYGLSELQLIVTDFSDGWPYAAKYSDNPARRGFCFASPAVGYYFYTPLATHLLCYANVPALEPHADFELVNSLVQQWGNDWWIYGQVLTLTSTRQSEPNRVGWFLANLQNYGPNFQWRVAFALDDRESVFSQVVDCANNRNFTNFRDAQYRMDGRFLPHQIIGSS